MSSYIYVNLRTYSLSVYEHLEKTKCKTLKLMKSPSFVTMRIDGASGWHRYPRLMQVARANPAILCGGRQTWRTSLSPSQTASPLQLWPLGSQRRGGGAPSKSRGTEEDAKEKGNRKRLMHIWAPGLSPPSGPKMGRVAFTSHEQSRRT